MPSRELVAWVAPERTGAIWYATQNRGRFGDFVGVGLYEEPRPTRRPGLCEVVHHGYALRVFNESNLTPEQRTLGRENANRVLGVSRRDMLKAAAATPALGAFYFGYEKLDRPPVKAAIIGA